jgi:hypothetical protein
MTIEHRADWRPPTDADWRRLRALLHALQIHLEHDAEAWEQAAQDLRTIRGEHWSVGRGRYADRASWSRELATWVADEYSALSGDHQRQVPLDERGMFPGTSAL